MTIEDRLEYGAVGAFGVLLTIATPQLPRDAQIIVWLAYVAFCIGFGIYKARRRWGQRMTFPIVLTLSITLAVIAAAIAWYVFPPGVDATSNGTPIPAEESLDLSYMALASGWDTGGKPLQENQLVIQGELVNRSPRNMSLEFRLLIRLPDRDGERGGASAIADWKARWDDPNFMQVINIPRETSLSGIWVYRIPDVALEGSTVKDISKVPLSKMALKITDKVSGVSVFSHPAMFPPVLKGGFAGIAWEDGDDAATGSEQNKKNSTVELPEPQQTLGLLFRPKAYSHSDKYVEMPATITNRSPRRMGLEFALLIRSPNGKSWESYEGRWDGQRSEIASGLRTINIDIDETLDGVLIFDLPNPKIMDREKWNITGRRKDNLIEISDRVTGQRVCCTLYEGYPPEIEAPWVPLRSPSDNLGTPKAEKLRPNSGNEYGWPGEWN
jgi:hypothetical protein